MKKVFIILLVSCLSNYSSAQETNEKVKDIGYGIASENMLLSLDACIQEAEQQGIYRSCTTAKNYYLNIRHYMSNMDLSKMDVSSRIRIEKRLAIIESLQLGK